MPSADVAAALERVRRQADPPVRPRKNPLVGRVLDALWATGGRRVRAAELVAEMPGIDVHAVAAVLGASAGQGRVERRDGRRGPSYKFRCG